MMIPQKRLRYGYDDENKVVFSAEETNIENVCASYSYASIENAFYRVYMHYIDNAEKMYKRKYWYDAFNMITLKKLVKQQSLNSIYDMLAKFRYERDGNIFKSLDERSATYAYGVSCLNLISDNFLAIYTRLYVTKKL